MLDSYPDKALVPHLGIFGSNVDRDSIAKDPGIRMASGVIVVGTAPDLQDMDCDLVVGDIIHSINGKNVSNLASLRTIVETFRPGDAIALHIERHHKFSYVVFEAE